MYLKQTLTWTSLCSPYMSAVSGCFLNASTGSLLMANQHEGRACLSVLWLRSRLLKNTRVIFQRILKRRYRLVGRNKVPLLGRVRLTRWPLAPLQL